MPSLHSFNVQTDAHPRVSNTDELMIVHRNHLIPLTTVYVGAHQAAQIEVREATNRNSVEGASPTLYTIPAGGKLTFQLGTTSPLDLVAKITPLTGQVYVWIAAMGEFDTYLKQYEVPSI